jgi:ribosomal protein S18 acetylase RimI-like enzyme
MGKAAEDVKIVPIAEGHIEGFYHCLDAVARERSYLGMVQAPPLDAIREFVRSTIAGGVPQFVAVAGDRVIGWCDVIPRRREGYAHCGILGMGVLAEYRGRGIGRRLAVATIERAREIGLERVELEVYASNAPAIGLYGVLGFVVEGVKVNARKLDGVYDDNICMALLF